MKDAETVPLPSRVPASPSLTAREILAKHDRIWVAGFPAQGKTRFAHMAEGGRIVVHTDNFLGSVSLEDLPREVLLTLAKVDGYLVEGAQVPRVLRFGFKNGAFDNRRRRPPQAVVWVTYGEIEPRHVTMSKGLVTVFNSIPWPKELYIPIYRLDF